MCVELISLKNLLPIYYYVTIKTEQKYIPKHTNYIIISNHIRIIGTLEFR